MRFGRTLKITGAVGVLLVAAFALWLATFDVNRYKPEILAAVKQTTGRELVLEGPLRLRLLPHLALRVKGAAFANAPWGERPEMVRVDDFAIQVALVPLLRGHLVVRRVELNGADVLLERNAAGYGNWQLALGTAAGREGPGPKRPAAPARKGAMPTPHLEELLVRNAHVAYHDAHTGRQAELSLERLRVTTDDPSAPLDLGLDLAGALNGLEFSLAGRVGALEKLTPVEGASFPLDLTLRLGDALSAHVRGGLREPLLGRGIALDFQLDSGDLSRVGRAFGRELPLAGPLDLSAHLSDPEVQHYLVNDLSIRLAAGDVRGRIEADLHGPRPALALDLSSQAFEPAKLRPGARSEQGSKDAEGGDASKKERRVIPATPLPFDALRQAPDTRLRWRMERLVAGGATLSRVDLQARLQEGALTLRPLAAELAGGHLDAELGLVAAHKATSLRLDARGVVLGDLLRALGAGSALERGPTDLSLDLSGRGETLRAVAADASGRVVLHTHDGTLDSGILDRLGQATAELLGRLLGGDSRVPLRCGVARFDLRDGTATSRVLLLDTPRAALIGSGSIDLGSERPDLLLWARTRTAAVDQAVPRIRVAGSLARPRFQPDTVSTALSAAESLGSKNLRRKLGELAPLLGGESAPRLLSCEEALAISSGRAAPEPAPVGEPTSRERAQESLRRGLEGLLGR